MDAGCARELRRAVQQRTRAFGWRWDRGHQRDFARALGVTPQTVLYARLELLLKRIREAS